MSRARRDIIYDECVTHTFYKCHDGSFYFKDDAMKQEVLEALVKGAQRYGIPVFDWVIMSNHIHLMTFVERAMNYSNFMRYTNRLIAGIVNKSLKKTGQVIQDRYRSPVIQDESYCINTVGYIWLNPYKANMLGGKNPATYRFSSLFYKYNGLKDPLSTPYSELKKLIGFDILQGKKLQRFTREHITRLIQSGADFSDELFENLHSIGSESFCKERRHLENVRGASP